MKQKIIIFEGHDMVGKTEIATALAKELGITVYKNKNEQSRWRDQHIALMYSMDELVQFVEQGRFSVIFDRFHGSEYAYSATFNRYTSLDKIKELDERLASMGAVIVYLYKSEDKYLEDDEDIVRVDQYNSLKSNYNDFLKNITICKTVTLCTDSENLDEQVKYLLDNI
jgi:thymidylate kinase